MNTSTTEPTYTKEFLYQLDLIDEGNNQYIAFQAFAKHLIENYTDEPLNIDEIMKRFVAPLVKDKYNTDIYPLETIQDFRFNTPIIKDDYKVIITFKL